MKENDLNRLHIDVLECAVRPNQASNPPATIKSFITSSYCMRCEHFLLFTHCILRAQSESQQLLAQLLALHIGGMHDTHTRAVYSLQHRIKLPLSTQTVACPDDKRDILQITQAQGRQHTDLTCRRV